MVMHPMSQQLARTVWGEISADKLGAILTHEHLYCDFSIRGGNPDNKMLNKEVTVRELSYFNEAGGGTIFELTPLGLGTDPEALRFISEASGVHILRGI